MADEVITPIVTSYTSTGERLAHFRLKLGTELPDVVTSSHVLSTADVTELRDQLTAWLDFPSTRSSQ